MRGRRTGALAGDGGLVGLAGGVHALGEAGKLLLRFEVALLLLVTRREVEERAGLVGELFALLEARAGGSDLSRLELLDALLEQLDGRRIGGIRGGRDEKCASQRKQRNVSS